MKEYRAEVFVDEKFKLSEGPVWEKETQTLHFVDIKGSTIHKVNLADGKRSALELAQNVGCFALRKNGGYIAGLAAGVYLFSEDGQSIEKLSEPDFDPMTRANDGKCDPVGRFWCGTADLVGGVKRSKLYLLPGDGRCIEMMDGLECSNGLAFWEDKLFYIDSNRHRIDEYTIDEENLTLINHRVVTEIPRGQMVPDGMTIDEEGMLWAAHWGGGFVGRYNPKDGQLLEKVVVPASQSSSCCFGGNDMKTLFITSASLGVPDETEAGKVFAVQLPYRGVDSYRFMG